MRERRGSPPIVETLEHEDRLLTVQALADYLDVPVPTLYAWRYRREGPPGFRVGKHLRYRWTDIEDWVECQFREGTRR